MTPAIRPLLTADLEELGRFLTAGFQTAPDAVFASPAVLRWKYLSLEGQDDAVPCSYLARDDTGQIVGHVGTCRTFFQGACIPDTRVQTLHMIDWLGSPAHRAIGASLMRKAHSSTPTQFGLGGSEAGRTVIKRCGYQFRQPVSVYERVLRPSHRLHHPNQSFASAALRAARDLATCTLRPVRRARARVGLQRVSSFDEQTGSIVQAVAAHTIVTDRRPERLNHLLQFPCQQISGWHLLSPSGESCGFAILNIVPKQEGYMHVGKIVDCLLPTRDVLSWHAAIVALTTELLHQGADVAQAFASTPWIAQALLRAGFAPRFALEFNLRDPRRLIPDEMPFHLMPIEADYAYS